MSFSGQRWQRHGHKARERQNSDGGHEVKRVRAGGRLSLHTRNPFGNPPQARRNFLLSPVRVQYSTRYAKWKGIFLLTNDNFSRMYTPPDPSLDDYDALIDYALPSTATGTPKKSGGSSRSRRSIGKRSSPLSRKGGGTAPLRISAVASLPISGAFAGRKAGVATGKAAGNL